MAVCIDVLNLGLWQYGYTSMTFDCQFMYRYVLVVYK